MSASFSLGFVLIPSHNTLRLLLGQKAKARLAADVIAGKHYNTWAFSGRFNMGGLLRWPFERFYCGCPLITTNGFRVGTLCLGGDNPRKMTSHEVRRQNFTSHLRVLELSPTYSVPVKESLSEC